MTQMTAYIGLIMDYLTRDFSFLSKLFFLFPGSEPAVLAGFSGSKKEGFNYRACYYLVDLPCFEFNKFLNYFS